MIMNTALKFAVFPVLFFGQSLGMVAQTDWYNPMIDSLLPIHGRAWNAEIGKCYQRLPQRAKELVRKPVWDLSLQTAGLYVKFYTNAPKIFIENPDMDRKYLVFQLEKLFPNHKLLFLPRNRSNACGSVFSKL